MTIENNTKLPIISKIEEQQGFIHYFFIFNEGGVCLYCRNFTNTYQMEEQLISAFCCALMSFSKEMVGKKVKKVNMSPLEIVIIQRYNLSYGFLTDLTSNTIILEDYIDAIDNRIRKYIRDEKIDISMENIRDEKLNIYIDELIGNNADKSEDTLITNRESALKEELKKFLFRNDVEGLILFNNAGRIVYSSLTNDKLNYILENIDFRIKIMNKLILKLFYTTESELIFSKFINEEFYLVLIFNITIPFGIAEYLMDKIIRKADNICKK
ncbi:MAG: hypothetical protein BAJALOKI1v1_1390007 [Promethearchaeota archaeon]|nr:MAG: hypothetical protein BAJALOKI1v1_1390007 [Candidatus Lokiarchaeota archaeon]